MTNLIRSLFPSLGDVVAAATLTVTGAVIYLEHRRQENEHFEELERRARARRDDARDAHFRIR